MTIAGARASHGSWADRAMFPFLFLLTPFFDALTGYLIFSGALQEGGLLSPSQLYRLFLLVALFAFGYARQKDFLAFIIVIVALFVVEYVSCWRFGLGIRGLLVGVSTILKVGFGFLTYFAFRSLLERSEADAIRILLVLSVVYCAWIILSVAGGFSNATYKVGTFGTKGPFSSGNGLSLFLGSMAALAAITYYQRRKYLITTLVLLAGTVVIGTKASAAFALLTCFVLFLSLRGWQKAVALLLLALSLPWLSLAASQIFDVVLHRYSSSSDVVSFLATGRDNYVSSAFWKFTHPFDGFRLMFGSGALQSFYPPYSAPAFTDFLETDFFDVLFMYGIWGLVAYLSIISWGLWSAWHNRRGAFGVLFGSVAIYSLWAGHVLFDGMAVISLTFLLALCRQPRTP